MPFTYEFIDNGDSININKDNVKYTAGKNLVELVIDDSTEDRYLEIRSNSAKFSSFVVDVTNDTITGVGSGSSTATQLMNALKAIFFLDESAKGGGVVVRGSTPPSDNSELWFNTNEEIIYFYDGSDWLSEQVFDVVFNDPGQTPNNTWFRSGNTAGNDLGNGYHIGYDVKIEELSFNRSPSTAQSGFFWLYSNEQTGTDNAAVICTFLVGTEARGVLTPNVPTTISNGKYISMRWNGNQTNNNVAVLKFRKKHV